jgi:hypothetical protein
LCWEISFQQDPKLLEGFRNLAMAILVHVNFELTRCEHFQTFPFPERCRRRQSRQCDCWSSSVENVVSHNDESAAAGGAPVS